MTVTLAVDSHQIEVDFRSLESFVRALPDDQEQLLPVFAALAHSASADVRCAVARKSQLSPETIALLAADPTPEVVEALVSEHTKDIPEATLVGIIRRNWTQVNCNIASRIHDCDEADVTALAKLLAAGEDPAVRSILACNCSLPKAFRKRFLADPDPEVRKTARQSILY